jgi:hypothetical protein
MQNVLLNHPYYDWLPLLNLALTLTLANPNINPDLALTHLTLMQNVLLNHPNLPLLRLASLTLTRPLTLTLMQNVLLNHHNYDWLP